MQTDAWFRLLLYTAISILTVVGMLQNAPCDYHEASEAPVSLQEVITASPNHAVWRPGVSVVGTRSFDSSTHSVNSMHGTSHDYGCEVKMKTRPQDHMAGKLLYITTVYP
jgi:hypothetical protein